MDGRPKVPLSDETVSALLSTLFAIIVFGLIGCAAFEVAIFVDMGRLW